MLKLDAQVPSISFYLERHIFEVHTAIIKFLSTDKIFATLLFSIYKLCYSNWNLLFIVRTWCFRNIFGIQLDYLQIENNTFLCFLLVNQKKTTKYEILHTTKTIVAQKTFCWYFSFRCTYMSFQLSGLTNTMVKSKWQVTSDTGCHLCRLRFM